MKITKLVILFNKDKILIGIAAALGLATLAVNIGSWLSTLFLFFTVLILLNILLALVASYLLYDRSDLYRPEKLFADLTFTEESKAILLHASFDPVSEDMAKLLQPATLQVYNLYGNRHEDEKSIAISNKVFPPNKDEETIDPSRLPDKAATIDYLFAITSLHEILIQEERVKFFKEANRVLKAGGTLIICEQLRNLTNFLFFNIGAFHFVSLANWEQAIADGGLKIVKRKQLTLWGTVLYVQKQKTIAPDTHKT